MTPVVHHDRVSEHGTDWVEAGLITRDQLAAIRRFEQLDDHDHGQDDPHDRRPLPIGAEVAVYLGSVLALTAGAFVVADRWDDLAFALRLAVALALVAVGVLSGAWGYRQGDAGTDRIGGFLTVVGLGGLAFAVGLVVDRLDPSADELLVVAAGSAVIAAGTVLWRNRSRPLELLVSAMTTVPVVVASVAWLDVDMWLGGVVLLIIGTAIAVGGKTRLLRPECVATGVGAVIAYIGAFALSEADEHLGPAVALAVALSLVVSAVRRDEVPLLTLGVVGALVAAEGVLATTFDGAIAASIVALIGLAIVVATVLRASRRVGGDDPT